MRFRVVSSVIPAAVALLLSGCDSGRRQSVAAAAVLGPAGGELVVTSGPQQGLRLIVPAGAIASPVEVRVIELQELPSALPAGALATSTVGQPGRPFRLEPVDLVLAAPVRLLAPFVEDPMQIPLGNVRLQQAGAATVNAPSAVDMAAGLAEFSLTAFGANQVVYGPVGVSGRSDYLPALGATSSFGDGWTFACEPAAPTSPFAALGAFAWRIRGPQVDDVLYVVQDRLVGRESVLEDWREVWNAPLELIQSVPGLSVNWNYQNTTAQISRGSAAFAGTIDSTRRIAGTAPRVIGGTLVLDQMALELTLVWNRVDLGGIGQRSYDFVFAPGLGVVALSQDGVERIRTGP